MFDHHMLELSLLSFVVLLSCSLQVWNWQTHMPQRHHLLRIPGTAIEHHSPTWYRTTPIVMRAHRRRYAQRLVAPLPPDRRRYGPCWMANASARTKQLSDLGLSSPPSAEYAQRIKLSTKLFWIKGGSASLSSAPCWFRTLSNGRSIWNILCARSAVTEREECVSTFLV